MEFLLKIIIEVICWITAFSMCRTGNDGQCTWTELFDAIFHVRISGIGFWLLMASVLTVRIMAGIPIALIVFASLCLQVLLVATILRKVCASNA